MANGLVSLLFNNETTYRTDYSYGEIPSSVKNKYRSKHARNRVEPAVLKDVHTLSDWNNAIIPFDLFGKPKDVVRTNPKRVQEVYVTPLDVERELVQKTRPRPVMSPAVSLDDASPRTRQLLVGDVYLTTTTAMLEGVPSIGARAQRTPPSELPAPANPIVLPKWRAPRVSREWRLQSAAWDGRQLRAHCEPCRRFYLARELTCSVCQPAPPKDK